MSGTLDLSGYKLTFDDEFNSFSWNSNGQPGNGTWQTDFYFGGRSLPSNGELETYSDPSTGTNPFSITPSGDMSGHSQLDIQAKPNGSGGYTSGLISTEPSFSQTHGYFEMRAELPAGKGLWPAFWLLPTDKSWPPELDVLEAFGGANANGEGGANQAHVNAISGNSSESNGQWVKLPSSITSGYHNYGVNWDAQHLTYYIDGQEVAQVNTPSDMNKPMYMIANLAVGGSWPGNPDGSTQFPADMKVDYIRAYSNDPNAKAVTPQSGYNGTTGASAAPSAAPAPAPAPAPASADASAAPPADPTPSPAPSAAPTASDGSSSAAHASSASHASTAADGASAPPADPTPSPAPSAAPASGDAGSAAHDGTGADAAAASGSSAAHAATATDGSAAPPADPTPSPAPAGTDGTSSNHTSSNHTATHDATGSASHADASAASAASHTPSPSTTSGDSGASSHSGTTADSAQHTPDVARDHVMPDSHGTATGGDHPSIIHATGAHQTLIGNGGDDIFSLQSYGDANVVEHGHGIATVMTSAASYTLPDSISNLTGTGHEPQVLTGNSGNNYIVGSHGHNQIDAGAGNDTIVTHGSGNVLTGGAGDDVFAFHGAASHGNVVTDFTVGQDELDLSSVMKAIHYQGTDPVADHVLQFVQSGHDTHVVIDPHGASASGGTTADATAGHTLVTLDNVLPQALKAGHDYIWHH